jgi:phage terminase large subunit
MKLTKKQTIALDLLEDDKTTEVLYGGSAGGGKSALGCYWLLKSCLKYPGTRWMMGRSELKNLKKTTLNTFFEIAKMQGLKAGAHYQFNQQDSLIKLFNGSEVMLADLFAYPSDPNFDSLGSLEITGAFIDECSQVTEKAKNIVKSRIRYKIKEYNLLGKMLMTCNPCKDWPYREFYKPSISGSIREDRAYVAALPTDNPYLPENYLESLKGLDENSRQRLLYGNWEYDDDPSSLISYDKIIDCFSNDFDSICGDSYITVDVARFGNDRSVIGVWDGWRVRFTWFSGKAVNELAGIIRDYQQRHNIPNSRTIADEDGVGGGVVDILGCKGFVNNSRPLPNPITHEDENFANLKSQCYFKLAERINKSGLYIDCKDVEIKKLIIQELEQVKQHNMDKDGKKQVLPKDKVKEIIGRSPDFSDTLMMREWFELSPKMEWVGI